MSAGCAECLAIVRALATADPVVSQGGILSDWLECQLCAGPTMDLDHDEDDHGRSRFVHAPDCLWVRARDHAATPEPSVEPPAVAHVKAPWGDGRSGLPPCCVDDCPGCAAEDAATHCRHATVLDSLPPICAACGEVLA